MIKESKELDKYSIPPMFVFSYEINISIQKLNKLKFEHQHLIMIFINTSILQQDLNVVDSSNELFDY